MSANRIEASSVGSTRPRRAACANLLARVISAVAIVALLALCGCSASDASSHSTHAVSTDVTSNPYDFSKLSYDNGRYYYSQDGEVVSKTGIDVSEHQGTIDWTAVAADGIDFAYIRVGNRGYTEGGIYKDTRFEENVEGARAAGLPIGVYFFSQATSEQEAIEEAEFVLEQLDGMILDYPIAFDEETVKTSSARANNLTKSERTAIAKAFLERIVEGGYRGIVYCNNNDASKLNLRELEAYSVWYAEYGDKPNATPDFLIWQYTNNGSVSGINGGVDMNIDLSAAR